MKQYIRKHGAGTSAFVAGLCFWAGCDYLIQSEYSLALLEFVIGAANGFFYYAQREAEYVGL